METIGNIWKKKKSEKEISQPASQQVNQPICSKATLKSIVPFTFHQFSAKLQFCLIECMCVPMCQCMCMDGCMTKWDIAVYRQMWHIAAHCVCDGCRVCVYVESRPFRIVLSWKASNRVALCSHIQPMRPYRWTINNSKWTRTERKTTNRQYRIVWYCIILYYIVLYCMNCNWKKSNNQNLIRRRRINEPKYTDDSFTFSSAYVVLHIHIYDIVLYCLCYDIELVFNLWQLTTIALPCLYI